MKTFVPIIQILAFVIYCEMSVFVLHSLLAEIETLPCFRAALLVPLAAIKLRKLH